MPHYDYQCDACGHEMEVYQSITAEKKKKCPECGKLKLKRLIGTGAAIMFKGSGFYCTDYKKGGSQTGPKQGGKKSGSDKSKGQSAGNTTSKPKGQKKTP